MSEVQKIITAIGAIITVVGLISILINFNTVRKGLSYDRPEEVDKGVSGMLMGGIIAGGAATIAAAAVAALSLIQF